MIPSLRQDFNLSFTEEKYRDFLADLDSRHPGNLAFRVAETPVFVPAAFTAAMIGVCESIVDRMLSPDFLQSSRNAVPAADFVPGKEDHCQCIAFDFGVCQNEEGGLEPKLIEMQGFPSLYGFQTYYYEILNRHFPFPEGFSPYLNGLNETTYRELLSGTLLGGHDPDEVILLEIKPHEQKTRIDFYCTADYSGIQPVDLMDLSAESNQLFYTNQTTGRKTRIKRIYNRVIFDDLNSQAANLGPHIDLKKEWDVEWVPHPNWFYRISKYTLPFIKHEFVPDTAFLSDVKSIPSDLENYVLKPLFSFAGQGVIIDVTAKDVSAITDPQNWILQKKVNYAPVIRTLGIPAKAEIRIMYLWPRGAGRPVPATSLARLSKGKMIGVRYNKDQDWVGGCGALFESR